MVDHGRTVAAGTPDQLKSQIRGDVLEVRVAELGQLANVVADIEGVAIDRDRRTVDIPITAGTAQSLDLLRSLQATERGSRTSSFVDRRSTKSF
ncbi:MAG: hypothetical protein R2715_23015 [Ilumatobacteraceae bacterium]